MKPIKVELHGAASLLKPLVYKSGKDYICELLIVIGKGATPEAAVQDWNEKLKERLVAGDDKDEVVRHVKDILHPVSQGLKNYLKEAIRPPKKR